MHYLSQHIFVCSSGNEVVLLDLKHDRYMALDAKQAGLLAEFLQGRPTAYTAKTPQVSCNADEAASFAQFMREREILTTDKRAGKTAIAPAVRLPSRGLFEKEACNPPKIRIRHIAALLASVVFSTAVLRCCSIERVVNKISRQKLRCSHDPTTSGLQTTRNLVTIFYRLRPFMFRSNNACLFDSLTLINFLAYFGIFPQWVFGVRTDPFAAHCWVQQGETVFNDSVEHVIRYKPIMVV